MEGGQVASATPSETKIRTVSDELDELCVYYMAMGVSYDEFWHGDYCKLKFYEAAYQQQLEQKNRELWLQGLYVQGAFASVLDGAFGKGKLKYPIVPIDLFPEAKPKKTQAEYIAEIQKQLEAEARAWKAAHPEVNNGD